jgi:uncharacterized membrane protein YidH (DUF202 family)
VRLNDFESGVHTPELNADLIPCGKLRLMGILTILCGVAMIVMGALSFARRKSTLPELQPLESVVVLVPFGVIIAIIGVIIQSKA